MQQVFQSDKSEPHIPEDVIRFLKQKFPLEGFRNVRNIEQLQRYQGALDLIEFLEVTHARQTEGTT